MHFLKSDKQLNYCLRLGLKKLQARFCNIEKCRSSVGLSSFINFRGQKMGHNATWSNSHRRSVLGTKVLLKLTKILRSC